MVRPTSPRPLEHPQHNPLTHFNMSTQTYVVRKVRPTHSPYVPGSRLETFVGQGKGREGPEGSATCARPALGAGSISFLFRNSLV
jgi:hypothetical protein